MAPPAKGTVTPLASLFSEEEARKAASFVEEKIGEKREEMNRIQQFVDENANLINLVKKLPDQLHHNVMVPFGKLAFFPGRLIHTNECVVLLGENYYTERTSKQTVDILKRRDKTLQSQIHSLKAEIEDFQTEASFFTTTASEAAEGLVEIREEYVDEDSSTTLLQSDVKEPSSLLGGETAGDEVETNEFARIMSRLNELEMEEEAEDEDVDDKSEELDPPIEIVEEIEDNVLKGIRGKTDQVGIGYGKQETTKSILKKASGHSSSIGEPSCSKPRDKSKIIEVLQEENLQNYQDPLTCIGPKPQNQPKEDKRRVRFSNQNEWREFQATSPVPKAMAETIIVGPQKVVESPIQKPEPKFDANKAFTGSIIEHDHNLEPEFDTNKAFTGSIIERVIEHDYNLKPGQMLPSKSKPSKPISRYMAQRR